MAAWRKRESGYHLCSDKDLIRQIKAIVGAENILSSQEDLVCYG
jgi:hypothetical protein